MDLNLELTGEACDYWGTMYFADKNGTHYVCDDRGFKETDDPQIKLCRQIPSALAENGWSFATTQDALRYASAVRKFDTLYGVFNIGFGFV